LDTIISEVSRYYKVRPTKIKAVRRGIENGPRDVAMYLIRSMCAESLIRVGEKFGLKQYSSVSSCKGIKNLKTASNILNAISSKVNRRLDP
jgi:chromosomal replication initiation ATPase DnaA